MTRDLRDERSNRNDSIHSNLTDLKRLLIIDSDHVSDHIGSGEGRG